MNKDNFVMSDDDLPTLPFTIRVLPLKKLLNRSSSLNEKIIIIATHIVICVSSLPSLPSVVTTMHNCHHCHHHHMACAVSLPSLPQLTPGSSNLCIIIATIATIAMRTPYVSHGRYNLTIQSMIEFRLKMIQFNF